MRLDPEKVRGEMIGLEEQPDVASNARVVARLLNLDDVDDDPIAAALDAEVARVKQIMAFHVRQGVVPTLDNWLAMAFIQGITFAVAVRRLELREPGAS